MPLIVIAAIRALIQMAITLGVIELASRFVLPLVNKSIAEIIEVFGVDEETAKDIMANEWLAFAENIGVGVLLLRTKMPTAIAERLGFTNKGFVKRPLSKDVQTKVAGTAKTGKILSTAIKIPTTAEAETIVAAAKSAKKGFLAYAGLFLGVLGVVQLAFMNFLNAVDFGNWNSGAYQKSFQKLYAKITFGLLVPDEDYRKTKTTSPDIFDKVFNTYKIEGAVGINDPNKFATVPFTRNNMLDLLDQVGAELLLTKQRASTKDVLLVTQTLMVFEFPKDFTAPTAAPATRILAHGTRVFTGIISQGILAQTPNFTARENDIVVAS